MFFCDISCIGVQNNAHHANRSHLSGILTHVKCKNYNLYFVCESKQMKTIVV